MVGSIPTSASSLFPQLTSQSPGEVRTKGEESTEQSDADVKMRWVLLDSCLVESRAYLEKGLIVHD